MVILALTSSRVIHLSGPGKQGVFSLGGYPSVGFHLLASISFVVVVVCRRGRLSSWSLSSWSFVVVVVVVVVLLVVVVVVVVVPVVVVLVVVVVPVVVVPVVVVMIIVSKDGSWQNFFKSHFFK